MRSRFLSPVRITFGIYKCINSCTVKLCRCTHNKRLYPGYHCLPRPYLISQLDSYSCIFRKTEAAAHLLALEKVGLVRIGRGTIKAGFWNLPRPKDKKRLALRALIEERGER